MSILQDIARLPEDSRYVAFETLIREKARKLRIPTAANFELTPYCTLDCRMCYAKMTPEQVKKTGKRIIGKNEWKRITKEAAELGVYSVSITGGEPLLHPEFKDIYTDIYKNGMQTILMTNCTLIDNEMLDFLSDMPPMYISTTLYGFLQRHMRDCAVTAVHLRESLVQSRGSMIVEFR